MKTKWTMLMSMLLMAMMAVSFTACGSDDDDDDSGSISSVEQKLIGTWECTYSESGYSIIDRIVLNSDHTGTLSEYAGEKNVIDFEIYFRWSLDGKTFNIYPQTKVDDDFISTWTIVSQESSKMVVNNGYANYVYYKK
jgi:hypothetical protein